MLDESTIVPLYRADFESALISYKERHDENVSMVNAISGDMIRAITVWPNVNVRMQDRGKDFVPASGDPWSWVRFSYSAWQTLANAEGERWFLVARAVVGNHMVYPDGTLPKYIGEFLRIRAHEAMGNSDWS